MKPEPRTELQPDPLQEQPLLVRLWMGSGPDYVPSSTETAEGPGEPQPPLHASSAA